VKEPFQLLPLFRERVWGRKDLAPYFASTHNQPIGEVWFTSEENATSRGITLGELLKRHPGILGTAADPEHPGICPLLMKLLFTKERLSVQVHPDDHYAGLHHKTLGKTEAWYVLNSCPPGELGLGFRRLLTRQELKDSAFSGKIDGLLDWRPVHAGDIVFVPAGTVHAIGAGLTICEIQENSDITYRLYDFGRARELHLEHGLAVSKLGPHQFTPDPIPLADWRIQLLECPYFRIERLRPATTIRFAGSPFYLLLICTKGAGIIAGQPFSAGQSWMVPALSAEFELDGRESEWLLTYTAKQPASALEECA
jgi:mannose-6-phosphate isomerase